MLDANGDKGDVVDVLIIGAGISGIGIAHHIRESFPEKRVMILEKKPTYGGTWHTHRYPGIRSDSDLYTFGYRFKPWTDDPIASGDAILRYLGQVIKDEGLAELIRYEQRLVRADWSSDDGCWHVQVEDVQSGECYQISTGVLSLCMGYYEHDQGYVPEFEGMKDFKGQIVHPQTWPDDLDFTGKRVVVIGSGATAATLVPELAQKATHVAMLQRSPTYFWAGPNSFRPADWARALGVSDRVVHRIMRKFILWQLRRMQDLAARDPQKAATALIDAVRKKLPENFDVKKHFTPRYPPWNQRLAFLPEGDLFKAARDGKVSVVTDTTKRFTPNGVMTGSGEELVADIIVTATGFNLKVFDNVPLTVDGKPVDVPQTLSYRGVLMEGVPNLFFIFGYLRTSWTMRVELVADYICRLFSHMKAQGANVVTPRLPAQDVDMQRLDWIPDSVFSSGYIARGRHLMPVQGDSGPWRFTPDYYLERETLPSAQFDDGTLEFKTVSREATPLARDLAKESG